MPTYEYACRDCGHSFEIVQSMWDEPLTMCPECGGSLRKVFAPPAIAFKGSGFYATDHGKRSKKQEGDGQEPKDAKEKTRTASATEGTETSSTKEGSGSKDAAGGKAEPTKKEPATS